MTTPSDKTLGPTRLAIEAALKAVNPAMQLRWVKADNLPYIHASDDEVVTPYSRNVVGRFDYMDTCDYMLAACPKNMRQLLHEHDTQVAQLKAELAAEREQVLVLLDLYKKTELLIAEIGKEGEIDRRNPLVDAVLDALYDCDAALTQTQPQEQSR